MAQRQTVYLIACIVACVQVYNTVADAKVESNEESCAGGHAVCSPSLLATKQTVQTATVKEESKSGSVPPVYEYCRGGPAGELKLDYYPWLSDIDSLVECQAAATELGLTFTGAPLDGMWTHPNQWGTRHLVDDDALNDDGPNNGARKVSFRYPNGCFAQHKVKNKRTQYDDFVNNAAPRKVYWNPWQDKRSALTKTYTETSTGDVKAWSDKDVEARKASFPICRRQVTKADMNAFAANGDLSGSGNGPVGPPGSVAGPPGAAGAAGPPGPPGPSASGSMFLPLGQLGWCLPWNEELCLDTSKNVPGGSCEHADGSYWIKKKDCGESCIQQRCAADSDCVGYHYSKVGNQYRLKRSITGFDASGGKPQQHQCWLKAPA